MKNQFAGAAIVGCVVAMGTLWMGRGAVTAQAQQAQQNNAERVPPALRLSGMTGRICDLRYQSGADTSTSSSVGTLRQVDDNWVVLDVLDFQRNNVIVGADGKKKFQAVYTRANRQAWIATRLIIAANFDSNAVVR